MSTIIRKIKDLNDNNKDKIVFVRSSKLKCEYIKSSHGGWKTACDFRALGVNKFWRCCPYCGKSIIFLDNIRDSNNKDDDKYHIGSKK